MLIAFRLLLVVVVNGIVIYGVGWGEWNGVTVGGEGTQKPINSFFAEYLTLIIAFSVGHAVFLGFFLYGILKQHPDPVLLKQGALAVVLCQVAGLLADLPTLSSLPFAVLKRMAG